MGDMDLIFTPVLVRHLLGPPGLSWPMTSTSWIHRHSNQSQPTPFPLPTHPLIHAIHDITVVVKKLLKIQQCYTVASYFMKH